MKNFFIQFRLKILVKLFRIVRSFPSNIPQEKSAILIPAYTGLGNFILKTPWIRELHKVSPETQLDILAGNVFGTEYVLSDSGWIRETLIFPMNSSFLKTLKFYWDLRGKYEAILIPIDVSHVNHLYFGSVIAGIPRRIGHIDPRWKRPRPLIQEALTEMIPLRLGTHETDLGFDLVECLYPGVSRDSLPAMAIAPDFSPSVKTLLEKHSIQEGKYLVIQPTAANGSPTPKVWPMFYWQKWIRLMLESKITLVAVGDRGDAPIVSQILEPFQNQVLDLAGQTTVPELAKILKNACGVLCHDSGVMHMANALDVPLIALYGPQDSVTTIPRGTKSTFLKVPLPCSPCVGMQGRWSEPEAVQKCPIQIQCMRDLKPEYVFEQSVKLFDL